MVNNAIVNKIYKIKKKNMYQEKRNALFFKIIQNDQSTRPRAVTMRSEVQPVSGSARNFLDYDLRKQEESKTDLPVRLSHVVALAALPLQASPRRSLLFCEDRGLCRGHFSLNPPVLQNFLKTIQLS